MSGISIFLVVTILLVGLAAKESQDLECISPDEFAKLKAEVQDLGKLRTEVGELRKLKHEVMYLRRQLNSRGVKKGN